jgi:hypothetical protein
LTLVINPQDANSETLIRAELMLFYNNVARLRQFRGVAAGLQGSNQGISPQAWGSCALSLMNAQFQGRHHAAPRSGSGRWVAIMLGRAFMR